MGLCIATHANREFCFSLDLHEQQMKQTLSCMGHLVGKSVTLRLSTLFVADGTYIQLHVGKMSEVVFTHV